ncbi:MAG: 2-oxoacid:ferredoxin oxidoreductase subunit beta [bacterium]|jgi:2-oxoglutarate ferredoxin oxidoreductase subunit beta|nr:2-oxoacid:ferredoxin oxidoreductase subunit beta [bacterium]
MTATTTSAATNRIGLSLNDYKGGPSTLCAGCGHDAITAQIIRACYELGVEPHRVAKLSGIGCSSKTPAYFLNRAHGFNSVHGRMPSVATGVTLANRDLLALGVSGDGDTASIGLGQFAHMVRRNVPIVYIVENNGVYGLTKGQFSATADVGSTLKSGVMNELPPIDVCMLALQLGCTFVARSFSGDPRQLVALLQAAIAHRGTAVLDVVSPCVTFNNHEGSTKSYQAARDHDMPLHQLGFIPAFAPIETEIEPGEVREVGLHDGSRLVIRKLDRDHDPSDRQAAIRLLLEGEGKQELVTGLLHLRTDGEALPERLNLVDAPLARLADAQVKPGPDVLAKLMAELA